MTTLFSTPRVGRSNSTSMKWVYHTLTQKIIGHSLCKNRLVFFRFTNKEINEAKLSHKYQEKIGHTSERDFKSIARKKMTQNCPNTDSDVTDSYTMFGPNLDCTMGNTVQQNLDRVVMDYIYVPREFL